MIYNIRFITTWALIAATVMVGLSETQAQNGAPAQLTDSVGIGMTTSVPETFDVTLHVSPQSESLNSISAALKTAGENRAKGKSTRIVVSGGVYRQNVQFNGLAFDSLFKGAGDLPFIALEAAKGEKAVISGALPVEGWTFDGNSKSWTATLSQEALSSLERNGSQCYPEGKMLGPKEVNDNGCLFINGMLFSNGGMYNRVDSINRLTDGMFFIDYQTARITVMPVHGFTPKDVEIAVKPQMFQIANTKNFTVRNIHITGCGWNMSAATISVVENMLMENCSFNRNRWDGLNFHKVKNSVFSDVAFIDNGIRGASSWNGYLRNVLFRRLTVVNNNWIGIRFGWKNWDCCGIKWAAMRDCLIEDCEFSYNHAGGIWLDTENRRVTVKNCRFANNDGAGLELEANMGPITFTGCEISGNDKGVFIAASNDIIIDGCYLHDNNCTIDVCDYGGKGRGPAPDVYDFVSIDDGSIWRSHSINTVVKNSILVAHPVPASVNPFYSHRTYADYGLRNDPNGFANFLSTLKADNNRYFSLTPDLSFIWNNGQGNLADWQRVMKQDTRSTLNAGNAIKFTIYDLRF